jgi:hypothetical protein
MAREHFQGNLIKGLETEPFPHRFVHAVYISVWISLRISEIVRPWAIGLPMLGR